MKIVHTPSGSFKPSEKGKNTRTDTSLAAAEEFAKKTSSTGRASASVQSIGSSGGTDVFDNLDMAGLESYLRDLRKQFPGARFHIGDLPPGSQGISDYAQSHYGSLQIVLSPEALKRMMKDPEFKKECERLIGEARKELYDKAARLGAAGGKVVGSGIVLDENGHVSQWTASTCQEKEKLNQPWLPTTTAAMKDGLVSRIKTKDGKTIVFKKKVNYRPARDLSRIAQAGDQQMVRKTMSGIRASIYQLKSSGGDKKVVGQLVGQAEQVLLKARAKIKNLEKEDLLKLAHKRATQENETDRAVHLKRILKERQVRRRVREYTQIRDYYPTPLELKQEEDRAEKRAEQMVGDIAGGVGGEAGLTSYMQSGSPVPMGGAEASGGGGVFIDITL